MPAKHSCGLLVRYHVFDESLRAAQNLLRKKFGNGQRVQENAIATAGDLAVLTDRLDAVGQCPELVEDLRTILTSPQLTWTQKVFFWLAAIFTFGWTYFYGAKLVRDALESAPDATDISPTGLDLLHDLPSRIVKMAPIVAVFDALSAPVIEVNPMVAASLGGDLANVKNLFELIALVDSAIFEDRMADFSSVTFNGNTDDMFELVNAVNDYAVAAFWLASGTKLFVAPSEENAPDAEAVKSFADLFHSELDRQKASLKARYARNWYEAKLSQQLCAALPAMAELFDVASDTCVAKNSVASADCSAPGGKVAKSLARVIQSNGFSSLVAMATAGGESDLVPECFAEQVAKEAVATLLRVASEKKNFIQGIGTFFIDGELPPKPKLVRGSTTANECLVCVREIAIFCNIVLVGNGETEGLAMRSTVNLTDPLSDVQLEAFQEFFECFHAHVGATIDEIRNSYAKARVDASALTVNGKTGTANMLASEAVSLFLETPDLNTDASLLKVEYDDLVVAKAVELAAIKARNESALPKRRFQRTFRLRIE